MTECAPVILCERPASQRQAGEAAKADASAGKAEAAKTDASAGKASTREADAGEAASARKADASARTPEVTA